MDTTMLVGFGLFVLGGVALFGLLASEGALNKSKQFGAFRRLSSGESGSRKRVAFYLGLSSVILGALVLFSSVSAMDKQKRDACKKTCQARGYANSELRNSSERDPNNPKRAAFQACVCSGGPAPDPIEIDVETLTHHTD